MTAQRSFKHLVRTRMQKTGESYTAARLTLLSPPSEPDPAEEAVLVTSDAKIRQRTGRGWEERVDLLDEWGAPERTHREIARWVAEQQGVEPLAWNAQAVVGSYERARRGRAVGEFPDGFRVTASRTVGVPVERLYASFLESVERDRWLPDGKLRKRTATKPKSARFDWGAYGQRVHVTFADKGPEKSTVTLSHERLADAHERDRIKAYWRDRTAALKQELER